MYADIHPCYEVCQMRKEQAALVWIGLALLAPLLLWASTAISMLLFSFLLGKPVGGGTYIQFPRDWLTWLFLIILSSPIAIGIYHLKNKFDNKYRKNIIVFLIVYSLISFALPNIDRFLDFDRFKLQFGIIFTHFIGMLLYIILTWFISTTLSNIFK